MSEEEKEPRVFISCYAPLSLAQRLDVYAKREGFSRSDAIRRILNRSLARIRIAEVAGQK